MKRFHAAGICDCCDAPPEEEEAANCEHVWRFAHVLKRGLQRYRIYFCAKCLAERESRL